MSILGLCNERYHGVIYFPSYLDDNTDRIELTVISDNVVENQRTRPLTKRPGLGPPNELNISNRSRFRALAPNSSVARSRGRRRRGGRHGPRADGQTGRRRAGRGLSADDRVDGRLLYERRAAGTVSVRRLCTTGQNPVRDGQQERVRPAAADVGSVRGPRDGRPARRRGAFGAQRRRRRPHPTVRGARAARVAVGPRGVLQVLGVGGRSGDPEERNGKSPRNVRNAEGRQETDD